MHTGEQVSTIWVKGFMNFVLILIDGAKLYFLEVPVHTHVQECLFPHRLPKQWVIKFGVFGNKEVKNGFDGFRLVLLICNLHLMKFTFLVCCSDISTVCTTITKIPKYSFAEYIFSLPSSSHSFDNHQLVLYLWVFSGLACLLF